MKKRWLLAGAAAAAAALLVPVGGGAPAAATVVPVAGVDLSAFSADRPSSPLSLVFLHHSCGGQLLADAGDRDVERANCVYTSALNGGGLRGLLTAQGYEVHEASYGSQVADKTDLFDWLPKFKSQMDEILAVDENDTRLPAGKRHRIVMFKSCFTENRWQGEGDAPGNPAGPDKTIANAKAEFTALRAELEKRPDVLFVYLTSPPVAPVAPKERAFKWIAKKVLGKPTAREAVDRQGRLSRAFADWAKSPDGWLAGYPLTNVVVFDYFDVLTDHGASNLSRYATAADDDSHPSTAGNKKAAAELVPFLNRAVRRAKLAP